MGKPDIIAKEYMRRPDIFADVFNKFIYRGEQVILPEKLVELDSAEIAVPYGKGRLPVPKQGYRDVSKVLTAMTDGTAAYCIMAVENEAKVNYAMPVKDGLYDFMRLARQVAETARLHKKAKGRGKKLSSDEFLSGFWKSDRIIPVVTLVVYYGANEWDGPLSLREMYSDCDERILRHAADYRINLITPFRMSDDELDEFHTNFREVMKYIKYSQNRKKLGEIINSDERFKSVERQAADLINVVTGSKVEYSEGEEVVNMCIAIKEMREESRLEGMLEGEIRGAIRTDRKRGIQRDDTKRYIMEEYQKSEEEADELIRMYWE